MTTYTIAYHIAAALVSSDDSSLSESEMSQLNSWLEFQELEDAQWQSMAEDYDGCYSNEGFYGWCEVTDKSCLCDEIQPIEDE